jgi:hypothetical protein
METNAVTGITQALGLSPYMQVIEDAQIPEPDKGLVILDVNRHMNMVGGRPSDAARTVVVDYQASPERYIVRWHAIRDAEK